MDEGKRECGRLECSHIFCFKCIHDWAKVVNRCPLCKRDFKQIEKRDFGGHLIGRVKVKNRNPMLDYISELGTPNIL